MKLKVILIFLSLITLNICFGQTVFAYKKTITNNLQTTTDTKNISDTIIDTIKEPNNDTKWENKAANIPINNGVGLRDVVKPVAIDTVKYLKDSIRVLNKRISELGKETEEPKEKNNELESQIVEHLGEKGEKSERKNWVIENIYSITKGVLLILAFVILFFVLKNRKNIRSSALKVLQFLMMKKKKKVILVPPRNQTKAVVPKTIVPSQTNQTNQSHKPFFNQPLKVSPVKEYNLPKSFSNVNYRQPKSGVGKDNWFVVGASSIGKSHISSNKPCQDNHFCSSIKEGWGIAVSCDGAGSAENSHLGSAYVAETAFAVFKDFLQLNKFINNNKLPSQEEWQSMSDLAFKSIYNSLSDFAMEKKIEFTSVACTVTVVVFTPIGLFATHIGDGRAGYCNANGEWKSLITPHKGEEANQTIFLTSSPWVSATDFKMSEVLVPESKVINEKVIAFTLMSDGCESHSFDCSKMDNESNKWIDPNLPSEIFFNPLLKQLKSMYDNKVSFEDVTSSWYKFIEGGTPGLKEEPDDKTLILGILI